MLSWSWRLCANIVGWIDLVCSLAGASFTLYRLFKVFFGPPMEYSVYYMSFLVSMIVIGIFAMIAQLAYQLTQSTQIDTHRAQARESMRVWLVVKAFFGGVAVALGIGLYWPAAVIVSGVYIPLMLFVVGYYVELGWAKTSIHKSRNFGAVAVSG